MKILIASALFFLAPAIVLAQADAPAKKPAASKAAAAKAGAASKATPKVTTTKARPKAKRSASRTELQEKSSSIAAAVVASEAALSPEDLALAGRVHTGKIPCELGADVTVTADTREPGYFDVVGKGFRYRMVPVATTTGAIRLEDSTAGAVWLQVATKSMLMNQKLGQRLADECQSAEQIAFADNHKKHPTRSVLDGPAPASSAALAAMPNASALPPASASASAPAARP